MNEMPAAGAGYHAVVLAVLHDDFTRAGAESLRRLLADGEYCLI